MKLVFLYGPPAAGKLTVARELAALTGYRLFHNHLTVDLLLAVFEFGSLSFKRLRESIWLEVLKAACREDVPGVIFTFAPERTVDPGFVGHLCDEISASGGEVLFVELCCAAEERRRRIGDTERRKHGKLISAELFDALARDGAFDGPAMAAPLLSIDTELTRPQAAAERIRDALRLAR